MTLKLNTGIVEQVKLWNGIQHYYKLNDVNDSFSTNNLVNTNVTFGAGKNDNAAIFNGNAYLRDSTNINYSNTGTINFWINIDGSFNYYQFWDGGTSLGAQCGINIQYDTSYVINFRLNKQSGGYINTTVDLYNIWTMLTFTWNGNVINSRNIYINGSLVSSGNLDNYTPNAGSTIIGSRADGGNKLTGLMDEIGIWNRELSAIEVQMLYSDNNGKFYGTRM